MGALLGFGFPRHFVSSHNSVAPESSSSLSGPSSSLRWWETCLASWRSEPLYIGALPVPLSVLCLRNGLHYSVHAHGSLRGLRELFIGRFAPARP